MSEKFFEQNLKKKKNWTFREYSDMEYKNTSKPLQGQQVPEEPKCVILTILKQR